MPRVDDTPLKALSSTGVHCFKISTSAKLKCTFHTDFPDMVSVVEDWHDDNPPQAAAIMMAFQNVIPAHFCRVALGKLTCSRFRE
ncbi:hypothetical protein Bca52824_019229 [Brassica carinata]|uniref:Uncharacterized protein n=1 Tax=Brassica carinata TaxID=52824 RepID=A0A8X8B071_BRACI|nr:hypothetical protein Bca52824_019229 [Brassica carinata]